MEKIKQFLRDIGQFLAQSGKWLLAAVLVVVAIIAVIAISRETTEDEPTPEITQNFEPNIGRPEIPTTTPEPADPQPTSPAPAPDQEAPVANAPMATPTEPVTYRNDQLAFTAKLPADAKVTEVNNHEVMFTPASGGQYYTVSSFLIANETIASLEQQLRGSTSVTTTARTNIHGYDAIEFRSPKIKGIGYAILKGQRLYYVTGNLSPELLHNFTMI